MAATDRRDNERLRLLLAFTLADDACCIDVGAHRGDVLEQMVRVAPRGRHLAFEPLPHLSAGLAARFPDVAVHAVALADRDEERTFRHVRNMPGMSGLEEKAYPDAPDVELLTVQTRRLDDCLPPGYVPDLMKIDVEGAELLVLRGAERTLADHHPTVVFEYGRGTQDTPYGTTPTDIFGFLTRLGYRIFALSGEGPLREEEFATMHCWNWVAR